MIWAAALLLSLTGALRAEDRPLPEPPPGQRVDYAADAVDFDADRSMLHLNGNVELRESTMTVRCRELWIDTALRRARSPGPLFVDDGVSAVYGESGEFDLVNHTGEVRTTSAGHADWRIKAKEARLGEGRRLDYRSADFTSCNAKPPHYHFHATRITVKPHESMWARNVVFYLGPVPMFYTPVLYKSLSQEHLLRWKSQPGYDKRNGAFLKNTLTTEHGLWTYSKLYADYYQNQGVGMGGELVRRKGSDSRGALLGYTIRETSTNDRRWALLGDDYQALNSSTAFQGRLQAQSDADFNNHYARSSTFRVTPELVNGGAIVRRFSQATARVSYSRTDVADASRRMFLKQTESYPRLDVQSQPLRFGRLPWLNTLNGFVDNSYDRSRPYLLRTVQGGWEGTRAFHVARGVSFQPKLGVTETYYSRFDDPTPVSTGTVLDASVARWSASGDLRFDTWLGGVDLQHLYLKRLRPGGYSGDESAIDKGVEANRTAISDVFVPGPRAYARVATGYDYRTFRDRTVGFRDRVAPFVADASWQAGRRLALTARDQYQLNQGNQATLFDVLWGDDERTSLGGGLSWNATQSRTYVASLEAGVAPSSPTWRVAFGLRASAESERGPGGLHGLKVFEKEFSWTRRWHDFYTKLGGRFRPGGVGELTIRIDLKFGTANPRQAPRRDWESEWFPERGVTDEFRP